MDRLELHVQHDGLFVPKLREAMERYLEAMEREDHAARALHTRTIAGLAIRHLMTDEEFPSESAA